MSLLLIVLYKTLLLIFFKFWENYLFETVLPYPLAYSNTKLLRKGLEKLLKVVKDFNFEVLKYVKFNFYNIMFLLFLKNIIN